MHITILGSGGWGTALACLLNENGHTVTLVPHSAEKAAALSLSRENHLLPGVTIPPAVSVTASPESLQTSALALFAAPSFALRSTVRKAYPFLREGTILLSATKGIEDGSHLRMSEVIAQETQNRFPIAVLSGPSHAEEVARRMATGCVAASASQETAAAVQRALLSPYFRVYTHDDVVGVELSGAFKNVAALCCGIVDGYGMGDNTRALLMTRAMAELSRLTEALGGHKETIAGLAGMGDLIVTCTSQHSRNRRAGMLIGQGVAPEEAIARVGAVVEGYYAAKSACELAEKVGVEMPICTAAYEILYRHGNVGAAIRTLMARRAGCEHDSSWL